MNGRDLIRHAGITSGVLSLALALGCKPAHEAEYPYGLRPVESELVDPTEDGPPPSLAELRAVLEAQTTPVDVAPDVPEETPVAPSGVPKPDPLSRDPEAPTPPPVNSNPSTVAQLDEKPAPSSEAPPDSTEEAPVVRSVRRTFHDFRGEWMRGNNDAGQQAWRFERSGFFDCREDHLDGVRLERTGTWRVDEAASRLTLSFNEWRHAPGADGRIVRKMTTGQADSLPYAVEEGRLRIGGIALRSGPDEKPEVP